MAIQPTSLKVNFPTIYFGGDYTPEHWPRETWEDDMRLMKISGVNLVTINVFSWAQLQPNEETFTFEWLDELMDMLHENGISADLGTATASPPAWISVKYPEILPVDENGIRFNHGSRQTFNPSSKKYIQLSGILVRKLAERYKNHPALAMWHVNNELSHLVNYDYSLISHIAFRDWLFVKYNNLEALNNAWGTAFWGNTYFNWNEIIPPMKTAQQVNPSLLLDWKRFTSDAYLNVILEEIKILREITPNIPLTTNLLYEFKTLDYFSWAKYVDFISVSSFPDPKPTNHPGEGALSHDIMRGLKNQPFVLLEQAPSNVNWRFANVNKRPGLMRLWSYQGMAHGSDAFLFFQWRQSSHGSEKFHSAMVPHIGENSRVFREMTQLGHELKGMQEIIGTNVQASVAIVMDYNNWWSVEYSPGPSAAIKYLEQLQAYHYPLFEQNITTDIIPVDRDLSKYKVVIAPLLYMVKPGFKESIEEFVANGGTFITTFFSGLVDENDGVFSGGYPGPLSNLMGLKVEEYDAMKPYALNKIVVNNPIGNISGEFTCKLWADVLQLNTAQALAIYGEDYYAGMPAITVNNFGKGKAYYIATMPDNDFLKQFLNKIVADQSILPVLKTPDRVEAVIRKDDTNKFIFILNHNQHEVKIDLPNGCYFDLLKGCEIETRINLDKLGVAILKVL